MNVQSSRRAMEFMGMPPTDSSLTDRHQPLKQPGFKALLTLSA